MANSVDPDQTAPIGAVCSVSTLFTSILKFASYVSQLFAAEDFSRRHFQMRFFSWRFKGQLQIKLNYYAITLGNDKRQNKIMHGGGF